MCGCWRPIGRELPGFSLNNVLSFSTSKCAHIFSSLSLGCCGCIACDYERDGCTLKLINAANGPSRIVLVSGFRFARSSAVSARNVTGCAVMKMKTDVTFQLMILTQKKLPVGSHHTSFWLQLFSLRIVSLMINESVYGTELMCVWLEAIDHPSNETWKLAKHSKTGKCLK